MFIPPEELGFNLSDLIEQTISDWSEVKGCGLIEPESESYGDFIVAEMNERNLRQADGERATFNASATESRFKEAVIAALDRWLMETGKDRTSKEADDYLRPFGE